MTVDNNVIGEIGAGLLVLLGVSKADNETAADYLVEKITGLRIFEDAEEKMNLSIQDSGGAVLVVSQFTLYGDVRRGKRPSFDAAARPEEAKRLYEYFVGKSPRCGTALRDRTISGHDGSGAGELWAGDDHAGFGENVLIPPTA